MMNDIGKRNNATSFATLLQKNGMVYFFLAMAVFLLTFSGNSLIAFGMDLSTRFFRNILLIVALVFPIMSGVGLNFGITLGAMSAELALVIIMIFQIDNQPLSIVYWLIMTILISIISGKLLAALFNRTKGHEMIAGLLVGFFANGIYDLLLMVVFGDILKIDVNGLALSKGLPVKATVGLSAGVKNAMDQMISFPYLYAVIAVGIILTALFFYRLIRSVNKAGTEKRVLWQSIAGIILTVCVVAYCLLNDDMKKMLTIVNIPFVTALFSAVVCYLVYRVMLSKMGHDFISVRNDRRISASVGINVNKTRERAIILSTIIAGMGQVLYIQNLGTMNTYLAHSTVGTYAIAAILIGGATVKSANIKNVLIGNVLFQVIYGCAPNAAKALMGNSQLGEYFRVFLCYAIIAIAIVSNAISEVNIEKKRAQGT